VRFSDEGQSFGVRPAAGAAGLACYFESAVDGGGAELVRAVGAMIDAGGGASELWSVTIALARDGFADLAIARDTTGVAFYVDGFEVTRLSMDASESLTVGLWNPSTAFPLEADWIEVRPELGPAALCALPEPEPDTPEYCAPP
jgi:hypothetical protein